ncbi:hypothetical protein CH252_40635 [Rhodococcus sp. 06-1477-1B]|nr:hypothetical protein CH252_40635 [Rhodococcus sp. 06-1477-1B]
MTAKTMTETLDTFLKSAESWLGDAEAPQVTLLTLMARTLDDAEVPPSNLLSAFGREFRALKALKPATTKTDPVAAALAAALDQSPTTNDSHDS